MATSGESDAWRRFMASTDIDYERWHEGIGYDLAAVGELEADEKVRAEGWLRARASEDWRDLEALLALGSETGKAAVVEQLRVGKLEQRLAAARLLASDPDLAADIESATVAGLESALLYGGLSTALDLAVEHRTPAMIDALFRAALRDEGEAAVHAAARLAYVHGKATEPFDWERRPFFLEFAKSRSARRAAFRRLCAECGVDPGRYL